MYHPLAGLDQYTRRTLKVVSSNPGLGRYGQITLKINGNANLVILVQIHYKLLCGKARFPRVKMTKITLKIKDNGHLFTYQPKISQDACLVQIWWFQPKSVTSYYADKPNFLEFEVKIAKWPWRSKSMTPFFKTNRESYLVQIWWFMVKSVMTYRADNIKFTDGRTDKLR